MEHDARKLLRDTLYAALAGALTLGLAGCERDMQPAQFGKSFESAPENAARNPELPAAADDASGDGRLAARVKAALAAEPALKSLTVSVTAKDGVVTLSGTADSTAKSHQAAIIALNIGGVRSVKNQMVVLRGS
jgi:hyperosmotically inducible periplasmic protein